jgi:Tfp pilus assembly protein PilO
MARNAQNWKKWVRWGLAAVVLADAALVFVNVRSGDAASQMRTLEDRTRQHAEMLRDIRRAEEIEKNLKGNIRQQCDTFFAEQLRPADGGYSSIVADIGEVARSTGLQASGINFRERVIEGRGVVEVQVTANVQGNYPSIVRFINGLERSKSFYLLDRLALDSSEGGIIKLTLELRTYFRS